MRVGFELFGDRKPWVAAITGRDAKWGIARDFLRGHFDRTESNRTGTRGVRLIFSLKPGEVYEISQPESWGYSARYYAVAHADGLRKIKAELMLDMIDARVISGGACAERQDVSHGDPLRNGEDPRTVALHCARGGGSQ